MIASAGIDGKPHSRLTTWLMLAIIGQAFKSWYGCGSCYQAVCDLASSSFKTLSGLAWKLGFSYMRNHLPPVWRVVLESQDPPVWRTMLVRGGIPGCCWFRPAVALHFQSDYFWSMVDPDFRIQDIVDLINRMILPSLKLSIWPKAI